MTEDPAEEIIIKPRYIKFVPPDTFLVVNVICYNTGEVAPTFRIFFFSKVQNYCCFQSLSNVALFLIKAPRTGKEIIVELVLYYREENLYDSFLHSTHLI